jgi:hypothetical protein
VRRAAFALLIFAADPAQAALPARLPPIDQCKGDDSFELFRDTLRSAAIREDAKALTPLFAPEVRHGSGPGSATSEDWNPNGPNPEDYWQRLNMLLRMGCIRAGEKRIIPSAPAQLRRYYPEAVEKKVLVLPGADLIKDTDDPNSIVDGRVLKWDVATVTSNAGDIWTGVRLPDGRTGWIVDSDLYSLDYADRMTVEKRDGQWVITAFGVGE